MGYDVYITRAAREWESELAPITADEWLQVVADDPELKLISEVHPPPVPWQCGPHFAVWSGPSEHETPWLDWVSTGKVYSKNPDPPLIEKMVEIARRLGARVIGDDDEEYLGGGVTVQHDHGPG